MKLYGHPQSGCTRKVLMTLAEKNQEAQLLPVNLMKQEQKSSAHMALNPFGKVPVLDDDGFILYESQAIARYLNRKFPENPLLPVDSKERARAEQWLSVADSYTGAHVWVIMFQMLLAPLRKQETDQSAVDKARQELSVVFDALHKALEGKEYLAGDAFSLADITFMPGIQVLVDGKQSDLIQSRSHLSAWWGRVTARPSWKRVLAMSAL